MSVVAPSVLVTPEELLNLPDAVSYELVDGKLVERNMGMESSEIAARIIFLIAAFLKNRKLGHLFASHASYQCFPEAPGNVRRPDLSFVRAGRFEGDRLPKGHCRIPPDLAIEVVSPGDLSYEMDEKVAEYLHAGVRLVWVVHPPTRRVRIHRPLSSPLGIVSELSDKDTVAGEEVLPGFSCAVADFFG